MKASDAVQYVKNFAEANPLYVKEFLIFLAGLALGLLL